jgi:hypothetical protein
MGPTAKVWKGRILLAPQLCNADGRWKMNQSLHVRESYTGWSQATHWCLWWLVGLTCSFSLLSLFFSFLALFLFFHLLYHIFFLF